MSASPRPSAPFAVRFVSAVLLRPDAYVAIAEDPHGGPVAAAVVCVTAVLQPSVLTEELRYWAMPILVIFGVARWYAFTTIAHPIARAIGGRPVAYRRLLRCLGFAEAPAVFRALMPLAGAWEPHVRFVVGLWVFAALVVALRAALDIHLPRALLAGVLAFAAYLLLGMLASTWIGS